MAFAGIAHGQDKLQNYFSDVACKVKAAAEPAQKRAILDDSFARMTKALDVAEHSPLISKADKAGIDQIRALVTDKQEELAGANGFDRVPDAQLNAFADYVVQDMEQADRNLSISLVGLLLIIIIVILIT
jgi:hypothetical protein